MRSVGIFMCLVGQAWPFASSEGDSMPQVQHRAMSFLYTLVFILVLKESVGVPDTSGISQQHCNYCGVEFHIKHPNMLR